MLHIIPDALVRAIRFQTSGFSLACIAFYSRFGAFPASEQKLPAAERNVTAADKTSPGNGAKTPGAE